MLTYRNEFLAFPTEEEVKNSKDKHQMIAGFPGVFGIVDGEEKMKFKYLIKAKSKKLVLTWNISVEA